MEKKSHTIFSPYAHPMTESNFWLLVEEFEDTWVSMYVDALSVVAGALASDNADDRHDKQRFGDGQRSKLYIQ